MTKAWMAEVEGDRRASQARGAGIRNRGQAAPPKKKSGTEVPTKICMARSCRSNRLPMARPRAETLAAKTGTARMTPNRSPMRG
ncbi:hypothetical protein D3C80_2058340 [compost metagenome]